MRQRGVFPLALLHRDELTSFADLQPAAVDDALDYVNSLILALNHLYGISAKCKVGLHHTSAQ